MEVYMTIVFVNYPNAYMMVHNDVNCNSIQQHSKKGQRYIRIDMGNISAELQRFSHGHYTFAANPSENDMWLEIDFNDSTFEHAISEHIRFLLGNRYSPFANISLSSHC